MKPRNLNPLLLAAAFVLAGHAHGATIASANFTGLTANNATSVGISGTAGVNGFNWTRASGNSFTYSTPNVNMQSGTANALTATIGAGVTFQGMIGTMTTATTIPVGFTLALSFIGQYTEAPGNVSAGLRFGFINAHDGSGLSDTAIGLFSGTGTDNVLSIGSDTASFPSGPLGGSRTTLGSAVTGTQNIGTSVYTASFAITRTGTSTYSYFGNLNGSTVSATGQSTGYTNYNAITILNGSTAADFRIDNVSVTLVPEPSAALLGGLGLLALLRRRRD